MARRPDTVRQEVLDEASVLLHGDRNQDYGDPSENFTMIAEMWEAYLRPKLGEDVEITMADVSAMMILVKTARISTSPGKLDNWTDTAGYAALGAEVSDAQ